MEYGYEYEMLLDMGLLEENPNQYSYDYMIRYHATLYGVSELNILYRAFAGLGTGIEYSVEHGAFYEKKMLNIYNLVDFVPATDAYESRVFVLQGDIDNLRGFKLDNLNKDWHNGLKKLISNYDKNKVEINDELKEVFSQIKDEKIIESKLKELPKIMNKLKKLNKQLDEREAKMLSVLKINNKNK